MNKKTKQFFVSALIVCLLGTVSLPTAAASAVQELSHMESQDGTLQINEDFLSQVQNLVSDYWDDGYVSEIRFTSGEIGAQVDGKQIGSQIGCQQTEDTFLISAQTFADVTGGELHLDSETNSIRLSDGETDMESQNAAVFSSEDSQPIPNDVFLPADQISEELGYHIASQDDTTITFVKSFQTMRLIIQAPKVTLHGEDYGAVETIRDGNGTYVMQFDSIEKTKNAYEMLLETEGVKSVEEDQVVALEDFPESQQEVSTTDHLAWGANRIGTDNLLLNMNEEQKNRPVVVAVLDTGVSSNHSALSGRLLEGTSMMGVDNTEDFHGHGTHVSGIIADVTKGTQVKILPVQVLSGTTGKGSILGVASGIQWAVSHNADVINMSLTAKYSSVGGSHYLEKVTRQALANQTVVVSAAGNYATDTGFYCPAHVPDLLCVSAINSKDELAYFTNYGDAVDLAAPGVSIYSSIPGNKYGNKSGTSMAAPYVAAAASLLKSVLPEATPERIGALLTEHSDDRGDPGWDPHYGAGILNLTNLSLNEIINQPIGEKPKAILDANVMKSTNLLTINKIPDDVTAIILKNESGVPVDMLPPNNGTVTFSGLTPTTTYQIVASNRAGQSKPLIVTTKRNTTSKPSSSGSLGGGSGNIIHDVIPPLIENPPVTVADMLDTIQVDIKLNSSYQFLVKGNHDTANIKVEVADPSIASITLVDGNDPRGAKYQVQTKSTGTTKINVTYQGETSSMEVTVTQPQHSLTVDTASYTLAPGGQYTIGSWLQDGNGNQLTASQVQELIDSQKLVVRDSRTGSVFDLKQLPNGNFQVTGKQEGIGYVLYEIGGVHASVKITVQNESASQGIAARNTIFWSQLLSI